MLFMEARDELVVVRHIMTPDPNFATEQVWWSTFQTILSEAIVMTIHSCHC